MQGKIVKITVLAAAALMTSGVAVSGGKGSREPWLEADISVNDGREDSEAVVVRKDHKKLPKGLQKRQAAGKGLPPGWQKKLARGNVLDDEIYVHAQRLPVYEAVRYGARDGEIVVRIEGKLIRLAEATHTIIDIF